MPRLSFISQFWAGKPQHPAQNAQPHINLLFQSTHGQV